MIVAIDDSGDPGFKLGKGSSRYFAIAAVFFEDDLDAEEAALKIKRLRKELGWSALHEFKFRKTSDGIKQRFFATVKNVNFQAVVTIVDKEDFKNAPLRRNPSQFYNTIILETVSAELDMKQAHLYIDGEGGNDYRRKVKTFFRQNLPKGVIRALTYRDSREDNLIQLADMIAGAALHAVTKGSAGGLLVNIKQVRIQKHS